MTDEEVLQLLRLLHKYVTNYPESADTIISLADIAEDLAMSMDVTTDEADRLRVEIERFAGR